MPIRKTYISIGKLGYAASPWPLRTRRTKVLIPPSRPMSVASDALLAAHARLLTDRPEQVVVCQGESVSRVEDLHSLSVLAEAVLEPHRVPMGHRIGLVAPGGPGFLASFLALRRVGSTVVLLDSETTASERRSISGRIGLSATLICRKPWPESSRDWSLEIEEEGGESTISKEMADLAVVKLSSGSSGSPQGIGVTSEALLADERNLRSTMGIRTGDRILATVPFSHSYGFSSLALAALINGNALVLPRGSHPLAPLEAAAAAEATVFPTVPAYLSSLTRLGSFPRLPSTLRLVVSAGGPLEAGVAARFREQTGVEIHTFYGATECGGITYDREGGAAERGSVGEPVDGVDVRLVAVPQGEGHITDGLPSARDELSRRGLVEVSSEAVAATYLPEPSASLEGGVFRSRDIGYWLGSELALEGRLDDLINFRGRKFYPSEIERTLLELEGVEEAVVFGVPDPGRAGDLVLAAVVVGCDRSITTERVVAWCRARLSPFKVPRVVRIVGELPRGERGKIDRKQLHELVE